MTNWTTEIVQRLSISILCLLFLFKLLLICDWLEWLLSIAYTSFTTTSSYTQQTLIIIQVMQSSACQDINTFIAQPFFTFITLNCQWFVKRCLAAMAWDLTRYLTLKIFSFLHSLSKILVHPQRFLLSFGIEAQLTFTHLFYDFLLSGVQQEIVDA